MGCINVRQGEGRVIIYDLDGCGNPAQGASGKLILEAVAEVSWQDTINDGTDVTERNFAGQKVYSSVGQAEITDIAVNLTLDGLNPSVETLLMGARTLLRSGDIAGYGRSDLVSSTAVAMEVLITLENDACSGGATAAPVAGWFFPLVKNWKPNNQTTLNGTDLVKPQFTGKGFKNANFAAGTPSDTDYAKWLSVHNVNDWYSFYLFDGATSYPSGLPDASVDCEPETFT